MSLLLLTAVLAAVPGSGTFELGAVLGEPTGISCKYWFSGSTAFDGAVSWSLKDSDDDMYIHGDFLWHDYSVINDESGLVPVYYGIGGRLILADDPKLGARIPVGISWILAGAPLDLFIELAGVLDVIPDTDFDVNGGIGIRFVF